jgi:hypothetical protein
MFLTRLVYTSTASENFTPEDITKILETARKNNEKNNVTGMLLFHRNYFLQCLEGSRAAVNNTYNNISNDARHGNITILDYSEISMRGFSEWSMGYMPESSLTKPINLAFSGTPEFDPYEMSGKSAHKLMLAMKDSVPSI